MFYNFPTSSPTLLNILKTMLHKATFIALTTKYLQFSIIIVNTCLLILLKFGLTDHEVFVFNLLYDKRDTFSQVYF